MKAVVYVEGGSSRKTERMRFLLAMRTFLRKGATHAGNPTPPPEVVACESRTEGRGIRDRREAATAPVGGQR